MEQNFISQTPLDRMVSSDCGQMLKAAIPYLPASGRQILSVYEKAMELKNTISLFGSSTSAPELSAMSIPSREPMEMLNDIRSFCYGSSKKQLDQIVNMMAMIQMLNRKTERRMRMSEDWRNNPQLAGMDKTKLDMLQNLATQGSSKGINDMLPFLMGAAAQGRKSGLNFNPSEISTIIEVLKAGKSPEEAQRLDRVVNLMKMIR